MRKNVYYISEFGGADAQFSFQAQLESILKRKGLQPILYPRSNYFSRFFFICKKLFSIPRGSVVFFIHPLYAKTNKIILALLGFKKILSVCIVSDINSIRFGTSLEKEIGYWKNVDHFIFQNDRMKQFAENKFVKKTSENLGIFDLLFPSSKIVRQKLPEIVFAGNTEKCPFINDLYKINDIRWLIYSTSDVKESSNVKFERLVDLRSDRRELKGSFGLVWEGNSIDAITGPGGEYLKIVSPLKFSNYILNGLPVITHPDAAIAKYVIENNIGFCVTSLFDVADKINSLTEERYREMRENVLQLADRIATGYFTESAIDSLIDKIEKP
jgi:hypothetical protein